MIFYFENGITNEGDDVLKHVVTTGQVYWVSSVLGSNSNPGTATQPFQTLEHAITTAAANSGDIIVLMKNHVQTVSTTINVNKSGLRIFGLGSGAERPRFLVASNITVFDITASNVELNRIVFPQGTSTANVQRILVSADGVIIRDCEFLCGQFDPIAVNVNANRALIDKCSFVVTQNGPQSAVRIQNVVGTRIQKSVFTAGTFNWSDAAVYSVVAHQNFVYDELGLFLGAKIRHTAAAVGQITRITKDNESAIELVS